MGEQVLNIPELNDDDDEIEIEDPLEILQRARAEAKKQEAALAAERANLLNESQAPVANNAIAQELDTSDVRLPRPNRTIMPNPIALPPAKPSTRRPDVAKKPIPKSSTSSTNDRVYQQPTPGPGMIYAHERQRNNPVLVDVSHVKIEYRTDIIPDFVMNDQTCALYISLKYHLKNEKYLWTRMESLPNKVFALRVILCQVDTTDYEKGIQEITRMCLAADCTLILCFSGAEVARYLELYKLYENKSAKMIQVKIDDEYLPRLHDCLCSIRSVNKTDVVTLANNFGSLRNLMEASLEELALLPGIGEKKVKRLHDTFHTKFIPPKKKKDQTKQATIHDFVQK
ncbi:DNA excision repair protein ERCC [Acrasis kona]|uniref:DNA excision repair protein ERCC-1 n=1 Tax=Acrasis kona TaxID=1008807 RepID=A0AAW2ZLQ5_9EUKA